MCVEIQCDQLGTNAALRAVEDAANDRCIWLDRDEFSALAVYGRHGLIAKRYVSTHPIPLSRCFHHAALGVGADLAAIRLIDHLLKAVKHPALMRLEVNVALGIDQLGAVADQLALVADGVMLISRETAGAPADEVIHITKRAPIDGCPEARPRICGARYPLIPKDMQHGSAKALRFCPAGLDLAVDG
ncbi:hypothetical protein LNV06_05910 [Paucibacter sp. Y2R2-4]|nr:hypothetical protein [Paucibacter sp. Y2R2-4]MCV2349292.1 hypothetical protein [Paucibacter sp. Y2R2-4]